MRRRLWSRCGLRLTLDLTLTMIAPFGISFTNRGAGSVRRWLETDRMVPWTWFSGRWAVGLTVASKAQET